MIFLQISTSYNAPGTDQLDVQLGQAKVGDICQVHLVGNVILPDKKSGGCFCIPPNTEFIDTTHINKRVTVEIRDDGLKTYKWLYRGIHEALLTMTFGEVSTFIIPTEFAFGEEGLKRNNVGSGQEGDKDDRNPCNGICFIDIEPNTDLQVEVTFFRVARDEKWHNRKVKNKANVRIHPCSQRMI